MCCLHTLTTDKKQFCKKAFRFNSGYISTHMKCAQIYVVSSSCKDITDLLNNITVVVCACACNCNIFTAGDVATSILHYIKRTCKCLYMYIHD